MKLQLAAEEALGENVGAVVALDPTNGEVLIMASKPSFDPNLFTYGITQEDWERLVKDPLKPLLNRTIQSFYPPGSTFKIVTALAALQEGIVEPDTLFYCKGSVSLGSSEFNCWQKRGHGTVNLYRSLVESCDVYYYEVARRLGINRLARYAASFGLGKPTGLESFKEKSGVMPSEAWKRKALKKPWYQGETLIAGIGQGFVSTTPIQMAQVVAAVANDGVFYKPHLLKGQATEKSEIMVEKKYITLVKNALLGVVSDQSGTAFRAGYSYMISMAGKTGTAQVVSATRYSEGLAKHQDHAWFVAFSPFKDPKIAMAIIVEHGGHGGSACAPIAKKIAETYYLKNKAPKN
jgi:penicillin-binding protein 2